MKISGNFDGKNLTVIAGKVESYEDNKITIDGETYPVSDASAARLNKFTHLIDSVIMLSITDGEVTSFKTSGMFSVETPGVKDDGTPVTNYLKVFTGKIKNFRRIEREDKPPFATGQIYYPVWHINDGKWISEPASAEIYFFGDIVDEKCQELAENLDRTITVVTRRRSYGADDKRKVSYTCVDDGLYLH